MAFYFETISVFNPYPNYGGVNMKTKSKNFFRKASLINIGLLLTFFLFFTLITLIVEGSKGTLNPLNFISLAAVILSIPGTANVLLDEFNPKKKTFKLTCNCPKCKHLLTMEMVEN